MDHAVDAVFTSDVAGKSINANSYPRKIWKEERGRKGGKMKVVELRLTIEVVCSL